MSPALFEVQGNIYRVMYRRPDKEDAVSTSNYYNMPRQWSRRPDKEDAVSTSNYYNTPVVHVLELQSLRNGITVSVGEEINQDWIPTNRIGAFRIQDDVFVNATGFVKMTDIKIEADRNSDVDLRAWESFALKWNEYISADLLENSNIIYFTFDKNKFGDH